MRKHMQAKRRSVQTGVSLVELMISITVGLVLVSSIAMLIIKQDGTRLEMDKTSRQIENGRYATQLLQNDIQHAGFYGDFWNVASKPGTPTAMPNPCSTEANMDTAKFPAELFAALSVPVQGFDSITTVPAPLSSCLEDADHLDGTDVLVIRRVDTVTTPITSAVPGQIYMQTSYKEPKLAVASNDAASNEATFNLHKYDGTLETDLRRMMVTIYYVSPCNVPATGTTCTGPNDDGGQPIPTLKRLELGVSAGAPVITSPVPLVEGIQDMQLDFGLDEITATTTVFDGSPDRYSTGTKTTTDSAGVTTSAPIAAADWANVVSVRLNFLARNKEATAGYADTKTYQLGPEVTVGPFKDSFKRRVFSEVVRVVNSGGRREK